MGEWKETKLKDAPFAIIDGDRGKNYPPQSEFSSSGHCLFLSAKNVKKNRFDFSEKQFISEARDRALSKGKLQRNDIVLTTRGTVGNLAFYSEDVPYENVRINSGMVIVRPKTDEMKPEFCFYLFRALQQNQFEVFSSGSAQPQLPIRDMNEIDLLIPDIHEQKAIAEVLSSLDDKIDLLHRQNKTLESLAQTLFRQWFIEEADDSWKSSTLSEHTEVFRGLSYRGSGLAEIGNGLPMHNLNSIYEFGGYKNSGIKYYNGEYRDRHIVKAGDIIVANTEQGHEFRLIGSPAIVPDEFGADGLFSQHIYRLLPLSSTYLTNQYLYYLLMAPQVREQIIGATNGSTVNMLAIEGLQMPEFKLPPQGKVVEFSSIAANCWNKKRANHQQIISLARTRDSLLPKLMSGEVSIKYATHTL